jgi:hypothetical protein
MSGGLPPAGLETPFTLLTQIRATVGSASALLLGADGAPVLRGSLEGIDASLDKYPVTTRLQLSVTAMGVESPEGVFIRTGAEPPGREPAFFDRTSEPLLCPPRCARFASSMHSHLPEP